jgi:hypothetical protein
MQKASRVPVASYRGVEIRLYVRRDGWKATYQLHGRTRQECYGTTQARAQQAAQEAIAAELDPHALAAGTDENTARSLLSEHGVSLTEAARFWLSKHAKPLIQATADEIRKRWLEVRQRKMGFHHARSLRSCTLHFVKAFEGRQLASITMQDLVEWQDRLEMEYAGRTARNIHDATKHLFKFARKRGFLEPDRISVMELVDRPRAGPGKKAIYTPEQMQSLLDAAWSLASPAAASLALSAFAAIRSEELSSVDPDRPDENQLAWEDFRWKEKFIFLRPEVAKLGISREVPARPNLLAMVKPLAGRGPIYPNVRLDEAYRKIADQAGISWKHNALRHSAITYDMLLSPSPTEVANRAGNSVAMIESSYRNRGATKDQAKAWFKLLPTERWGSAKKRK